MRRWGVCGGEGRGGAAHGPPHTRMHAPTPPRTHATHSVKKVALDQLTFGPLNNICVMLFFAVVVEGRSLRYARGKIARDYPTVQARAPGGCCCCPCCCTPLLLLLLLGMVCARRQRWWCPAPATRARALPHARSLAGARLAAVAGGAVDQPGIRAAQGEEGVGQVVGGWPFLDPHHTHACTRAPATHPPTTHQPHRPPPLRSCACCGATWCRLGGPPSSSSAPALPPPPPLHTLRGAPWGASSNRSRRACPCTSPTGCEQREGRGGLACPPRPARPPAAAAATCRACGPSPSLPVPPPQPLSLHAANPRVWSARCLCSPPLPAHGHNDRCVNPAFNGSAAWQGDWLVVWCW